ncbi:hypothetical protein [Rhizobium laguerreae]|uniref:hypothetical protein n=1 Tax=Rhizobium laguerreae TaxID=1076926 RepID=UPI001C8FD72E|nr:hypothetical protein [Rhizobium laguerreae]MBY3355147.1 hypothetical protein [Rhizobium laguerreae]MBY3454264.1 hypothetical protein [Rhizobium laguerreae]MBY3461419.1 hypothetical protein [Rhizobium laguerreae]
MKVLEQFLSEQPAGLGELIPRHFEANIYRRDFTGFEHQASFDSLGCKRCADPERSDSWPTESADRGNNHRSNEQVGELYDDSGRPWLNVLTNVARRWTSELPMPITDLNFWQGGNGV